MRPEERDPLGLVLPELEGEARARAERLLRALGLLGSAGRGGRSPSALTDPDRARLEVERQHARELSERLEDLLRWLLPAVQHADACLWPGEPRASWNDTWLMLAQDEDLDLDLPRPGESLPELVRRVLARAGRARLAAFGPAAGHLDLWRARFEHARGREGRARERWLRLAARDDRLGHVARVDLAAARLERGDVRGALARLEDVPGPDPAGPDGAPTPVGEVRPAPLPHERLAADLRRWCEDWLAHDERAVPGREPDPDGDHPRAVASGAVDSRAAVSGAGAPAPLEGGPPLPRHLDEERRARPGLGAHWTRVVREAGPAAVPPRTARRRQDLGASVLAVLALEPPDARVVELDAAPALRPRRDAWALERRDAWRHEDDPLRGVLARGEARVLRGVDAPGTLDPECRGLALVPLLDPRRRPLGWLQVEVRGALLPSLERLVAMAAAWSLELGPASGGADRGTDHADRVREADGPDRALLQEARPGDADLADLFRAAVGDVGLGRRRWSGVVEEREGPRLVAHDGEALGPGTPTGAALGIERARWLEGPVRWERPDPQLALHAEAGCGIVIPWRVEGRTVAYLVLEGARRRDLPETELRRLVEEAGEHGLALLAERFRVWHAERFGRAAHLPVDVPGFARRARAWVRAARGRAPATLVGPEGTGKEVLVRWGLQLLGHDEALRLGPGLHELERGGGRPWLLDRPERLALADQRRLAGFLARPDPPRLFVTTRVDPTLAVERGDLDPDLGGELARHVHRVPALADRREELDAWVDGLLAAHGRSERARPPSLDPGARALLWRQAWPGGLRQLDRVALALLLRGGGATLDADAVREVLAACRVEVVDRLSSRRPDPDLLRAALASARTAGGRPNHTAAARLLGWDRGTLLARLREAGLAPAPGPGLKADLDPDPGTE